MERKKSLPRRLQEASQNKVLEPLYKGVGVAALCAVLGHIATDARVAMEDGMNLTENGNNALVIEAANQDLIQTYSSLAGYGDVSPDPRAAVYKIKELQEELLNTATFPGNNALREQLDKLSQEISNSLNASHPDQLAELQGLITSLDLQFHQYLEELPDNLVAKWEAAKAYEIILFILGGIGLLSGMGVTTWRIVVR